MRSSRLLLLIACFIALPIITVLALPVALSALAPHLVFRPLPLLAAEMDPAVWGLPHAHQAYFDSSDSVRLHGWWVPSLDANSCGTVILFHGRSANISTRAPAAQWFATHGYDVFLFDYRGYGASQAVAPTETGLNLDSEAAHRYVMGERKVSAEQLILLGQSMGAAMASHIAAEHQVAALVLVSPYTSAPGLVRSKLPPWLPAKWLDWERNRFEVQARVPRSSAPLVVVASRSDEQVPYSLSRELYLSAPAASWWVEVDGAEHNGLLQHPEVQQQLLPVLREVLPCGATQDDSIEGGDPDQDLAP